MEELMEQERMLEAKKYKKAQEADRLKKKLQATEIVQQMKENELTREWKAAKDAEVRLMFKYKWLMMKIKKFIGSKSSNRCSD